MRRLVLLICAVVLLCDLADDGGLGKVKFVTPQHAAKVSVASSHPHSGKADFQPGLVPDQVQDLITPFFRHAAASGAVPYVKIRFFSLLGSSGGIPL